MEVKVSSADWMLERVKSQREESRKRERECVDVKVEPNARLGWGKAKRDSAAREGEFTSDAETR